MRSGWSQHGSGYHSGSQWEGGVLQGGWILGYDWGSTVLFFWPWKALGCVGDLGGGGGGMGQESSEAVATWGEVVEMLCFRKMGNMM